jgi:hypothetical protein
MNLIQLDVSSAREVLAPWGIPDIKITSGWHDGNISVIIECEMDMMTQEMLLSLLEANTSISIPIVFKQPALKDFKFNFNTVP